jgi:hypothetical protein
MTFCRRSSFVAAAALIAFAAAGPRAGRPRRGYEPGGRGLRTSGYKLDSVNSPYTYYSMDLSADPGAAGPRPNPYYFDISQPAVYAAFELRYGAGTLGPRMKAWLGPNNEARPVIEQVFAGGSPTGLSSLAGRSRAAMACPRSARSPTFRHRGSRHLAGLPDRDRAGLLARTIGDHQ